MFQRRYFPFCKHIIDVEVNFGVPGNASVHSMLLVKIFAFFWGGAINMKNDLRTHTMQHDTN